MIRIQNLSRTFPGADGAVEALKNVSLTVEDGDVFGIIGMSGAGKSTLVRCINMLERPDEGKVFLDGQDLGALSEKELRAVRRKVTMIFQGIDLLMQRNVLRNVCFPLELAGVPKGEAKARAMELLKLVGLEDKARAYPAQLSGGQQQRVAIARALATDPQVLLCDEATSALDPATTASILDLIREINEKTGITVIIITHQMSVVESVCRHVAILDHGEVAEEGEVSEVFSHPKSQAARNLVFPEGGEGALIVGEENSRFIRVVFNGADAAGKPMIARMAVEKRLEASIVYASTRSINGKVYGSMLLGIPGGRPAALSAIAYLEQAEGVFAEEVNVHAQ